MISRNSSVTTSSNASSDQGASVAHETEGSDHHQDDMTSDGGKVLYPNVQEEVFAFDKVDAQDEEVELDRHDKTSNLRIGGVDIDPAIACNPDACGDFNHHGIDVEINPTSNALSAQGDSSEVGSYENTRLCSKCGVRYRVIEPIERDIYLCTDCRKQNDLATVINPETIMIVAENSSMLSMKISEEIKPFDELKPPMNIPELPSEVIDMVEHRVSEQEQNIVQSPTSSSEQSQKYSRENSLVRSLMEGGEQRLNYAQEMGQPSVVSDLSDRETIGQQLLISNDYSDAKVDSSEGAGISLLLKRSNSRKGPVVQSRTFTATNIPYEDLSYARDSGNSLRSSIGHGSGSVSSSIDFNSSRQSETRVQRQLSGRKSDMENYRYDVNTKPQSIGSFLSGSSNYTHQAFGLARSMHENFEISVDDMKCDDVEGSMVTSQSEVLTSENKEVDVTNTSFTDAAITEEGNFGCNGSGRTMDASTSELSSHTASVQSEQNSVASFPNYEDCVSYENGEDITKITRSISDGEASVIIPESSHGEKPPILDADLDGVDFPEVPAYSSLATITEIEIENNCQSLPSSQMGDVSPKSISIVNEFQQSSVPMSSDKDMTAVPDHNTSDHAHGILGMFCLAPFPFIISVD